MKASGGIAMVMSMPVRVLCGVLLCGMVATSGFCAQGPRGVGADLKGTKVEREKKAKLGKTPPLYTIPKSASWWNGGGPGPAGAGVK
jgi:hypothetical protein